MMVKTMAKRVVMMPMGMTVKTLMDHVMMLMLVMTLSKEKVDDDVDTCVASSTSCNQIFSLK